MSMRFWAPFGFSAPLESFVLGANQIRCFKFQGPHSSINVSKTVVYIETALGASKGFRIGLYGSLSFDDSVLLSQSDVFTATSTGGQVITWPASVDLGNAWYWLAVVTDDASFALAGPPSNATYHSALFGSTGSTPVIFGRSPNSPTGSGASLAFPSSLGTVVQDSNVPGVHLVFKSA